MSKLRQESDTGKPAEPEAVLAELIDKLIRRAIAGEQISMSDIEAQHATHRAELSNLLPALVAMAGAGRSAINEADGASAAARTLDPLASPSSLGRYQLTGHIGSGGMGIILQARDRDLG